MIKYTGDKYLASSCKAVCRHDCLPRVFYSGEFVFFWTLCSVRLNVTDVHDILLPNSYWLCFPLLVNILVIPELHLVSFFLLTDPVLQVPTHVAEYVLLSCFQHGRSCVYPRALNLSVTKDGECKCIH